MYMFLVTFFYFFGCAAHAAAIPLLIKQCHPKTDANGLRGLFAKRDFTVGEILLSFTNHKISGEWMQQMYYMNAAAVPNFEQLFATDADIQQIWSTYVQQSKIHYNILIETSFLHTNFTPLSNKKLLEYNLNLKNGAGGLGTIPETMKITVMKPIKKGEPLLRQYGLTWISLVFNTCRMNKKQLCYFNKNFKDIRSGPFGQGPMCKPNHMSSAHFASLWNQQERDADQLVLLDRKARKRFKTILKRLYGKKF